jgi:hypothetical protein
LYIYVSNVEKGIHDAFCDNGNILHPIEDQARYIAMEEPFLMNINDTHIRQDPEVKVVAGEDSERSRPQNKPPHAKGGAHGRICKIDGGEARHISEFNEAGKGRREEGKDDEG